MSMWIPGQAEPAVHDSKWRKQRMRCQVRDGFKCQHPGCKCRNLLLLTVHHVRPKNEGGTNELSNLITLCQYHHALLHGALPQEARAYSTVTLEQGQPAE